MPARRTALALLAALAVGTYAQTPPTVRLRGTLESVAPERIVLLERTGQRIELATPATLVVTEYFPLAPDAIKSGAFVGVGAMPQADGSQKALGVLVFPEAMRGTGEGHRPFDFLPQSTMTNATVAGEVSAGGTGQRFQLKYPGGEQAIVVPADVPVFSLRPGTRELLVPGARVTVTAQEIDGKPTATRIAAGRNGFAPPY
jgi:hypothetical protein